MGKNIVEEESQQPQGILDAVKEPTGDKGQNWSPTGLSLLYLIFKQVSPICQNCLAAEDRTYQFLGIHDSWGRRSRTILDFITLSRDELMRLSWDRSVPLLGRLRKKISRYHFRIEGMGNRGQRVAELRSLHHLPLSKSATLHSLE